MASRLSLYNGALRALGERKLASLTESRAPRFELDDAYDDVLAECLEAGFWNFAMVTIALDASPDIETSFGFNYVFEKPEDWVRTFNVSAGERFEIPLEDYNDEGAYWYADVDPFYVRYVSNAEDKGGNLALWPRSYSKYVELSLAQAICKTITNSTVDAGELEKRVYRAMRNAKAKDAMNEPAGRPPQGTWSLARGNGFRPLSRWNGRFS